jgi:SAM-dependent methyltransferase
MTDQTGYAGKPFLAQLYDRVPQYSGRADMDFYLDLCRRSGRTLELGCGTGRILIPAAEAGSEIVGLDISGHMLERCREKLAAQPKAVQERIQLAHTNMVDFTLDGLFDLVIIPFRALQHLVAVEDQLGCLRCVHKHLRPGGRLVFDVFQVDLRKIRTAKIGEEIEDVEEFELGDGRRLRRTHRFTSMHRALQWNGIEIIYYLTERDGQVKRLSHSFPFRYFFRYEVEHLLHMSGFRVVAVHGDFDRSPLEDDSPEMIFVAERT